MASISVNPQPSPVQVNPRPSPILIRVVSGPQGPAGAAEIYIQRTQPTASGLNAIWYQTGLLGNIDAEFVWDGSAWLEVSSQASGVARVIGVAPIQVSGTANAVVSVDPATDTDPGVLTLAQAADAAPVQDIVAGANIVVSDDGAGIYTIAATAQPQVQSDWLEVDTGSPAFILNKPDSLSDFTNDLGFVDAAGAAAAAPIQELVAGTDITIVENPGKSFTINAVRTPEHQSDWNEANATLPAYIRNKPTNVSTWVNDSGYITLAEVPADAVTSVNSKTGVVVLNATDVGALPSTTYIPTKTSDLTNDGDSSMGGPFIDQVDLTGNLAAYLPLAGGTVTGSLTVDSAFTVGPAGSARAPTPPAGDASTQLATTEWVQDILTATGAMRFLWHYVSQTVGADPGAGNVAIAADGLTIAISSTDAGGNVRNVAALMAGDTVAFSDDPVSGPTTEFARYDVTGNITENGGWWTIPTSLKSASNPAPAVGQDLRTTFHLNAQSSAIDGVSAGYGLTGGGVSGIVSLAIDTAVVAELSDLPTKVSDLTNDVGYITAAAIPTNVSAFTNDAGYITAAQVPPDAVTSVNGQTGVVVLTAADVGAADASHTHDVPTHASTHATGGSDALTPSDIGAAPAANATLTTPILSGNVDLRDGGAGDYALDVVSTATTGTAVLRAAQSGLGNNGFTITTDGSHHVYSFVNSGGSLVYTSTARLGVGTVTPASRLEVNGVITVSAGIAAAPALVASGDSNTGAFFPAADTFAISTAGVERLRVKSTGAVRYIPLAAAPTPTEEGDVYYDSTLKKLRVYDGTSWVDLH